MKAYKEKKIVFRGVRQIAFNPSFIDDERVKIELIEQCFKAGYVPMEPEFRDDPNSLYRVAQCAVGYAGKRRAREIGVVKRPTAVSVMIESPRAR